MTSYNPVIKNGASGAIFYVSLMPRTPTGAYQDNPTLASGDVKIAIDDGAPANLGTLPAVDADFTKRVKVTLSQAETNGDNLTIIFSDASGAEWCDCRIDIQTVAANFDTIKAETASILDDTGTTLDDLIDAIKAKTDSLTFTVAGQVDANIQYVNDVAVTGDGQSGTEWGPA